MKLFSRRKQKKSGRVIANVNADLLKAGVFGAGLMSGQSSQGLLETTLDDALAIDYAIFNNFNFPFKNIVFEGGGMKGLAYVGALQVLEEANILQNITRITGVSVGSLFAILLYIGYTLVDIKVIMIENFGFLIGDHRCGYCSLLPNLKSGYGWNPGKRLEKWLGEKVRAKTGNANSTFLDIYKKTGRELCIVVTNLNHMVTEYFHVKTTPNIPIVLAGYMSMAIPGLIQGRRLEQPNGHSDLYVDGGLLCNYPIHCYDGWFLSMKPEDSYFQKMSSMENLSNLYSKNERFWGWNEETIGMLLFANDEIEVMKTKFAHRQGSKLPMPPKKSKRYRQRKNNKPKEAELRDDEETIVIAVQKLMEELKKIEVDGINSISLSKLKQALRESSDFGKEEVAILFGCDDFDEVIAEMDENDDGEITFIELMGFIERKGIDVHTKFLGYSRREINTFGEFVAAIEAGLSVCLLKGNVEDRDFDRTIGINTGYIETADFSIEDDDKMYLVECGAIATRAFLRDYCRNNPLRRSNSNRMISHQFFANRGRNEHTERFVQMMKEEDEKIKFSNNVFVTIEKTSPSNGQIPN